MSFVRTSKFRHVFGTPYKKDLCYDNVKISKSPHESNMSAVNSKFIAVVREAQGGGAFFVIPLSQVGRLDINQPTVCGHKSNILDIAWNPFNDNQIASCSEDCTIKLWNIPDEGLKASLEDKDKILELVGHQRKVLYVVWHPCASNVLLSASHDGVIIIWNTETAEELSKTSLPEMIHSVCWNYDGSLIATTSKDKKIRVINPRSGEILSEGKGHEGTKPSKVVFCGKMNKLLTTGFSRMSDRQYALWDPKDLNKSLTLTNIDTSSGVLFPFFDDGTNVVFLVGKGDVQIRYFEVTDKSPYLFYLSMSQHKQQHRSVVAMPKRELDHMKCEIMRFYRLLSNVVEPVAMTVPRKSEMFQDDIYPPCPSSKPSLTAEEWIGGVDKAPLLVSISPAGLKELSPEESQAAYTPLNFSATASKEPSVLKRINSPQGSEGKAMPVTLSEYRTAYQELQAENESLKAKLAKLEG